MRFWGHSYFAFRIGPYRGPEFDGSSICVICCHFRCKVTQVWKPQLSGELWGKGRVWPEREIGMPWEDDSKLAQGKATQAPKHAL